MSTTWMILLAAIGAAQTEAPDLVADTPKVKGINARREGRLAALRPHLEAGRLGEDKGGLLVVRSEEGLGVKERAELRQALQDENGDRERLLAELARLNSGLREAEVRQRWVAARRRCCAKGWTLQNDHGAWKRKQADAGSLEGDFNKKD